MRKELSPPLKLNVVAGSNSLASVDSVVLALSDARLFDEEVALSGSDLGSALQVLSSFAPRARLVASGGGDARKLLSDIKSALKAAPVLTSQNEVVDFIHHGVTCDNCDAFPIRGTRYKSVTKPDFDLCSRCFDSNEAHLNDVYLKITGQPPAASEPDWETVLSGEQEVRQRIHPPAFIALAVLCSSPALRHDTDSSAVLRLATGGLVSAVVAISSSCDTRHSIHDCCNEICALACVRCSHFVRLVRGVRLFDSPLFASLCARCAAMAFSLRVGVPLSRPVSLRRRAPVSRARPGRSVLVKAEGGDELSRVAKIEEEIERQVRAREDCPLRTPAPPTPL